MLHLKMSDNSSCLQTLICLEITNKMVPLLYKTRTSGFLPNNLPVKSNEQALGSYVCITEMEKPKN